jgi:hypothetical protein
LGFRRKTGPNTSSEMFVIYDKLPIYLNSTFLWTDFRFSDFNCQQPIFGGKFLGTEFWFWVIGYWFWILDFGFWILDFGFWIL